MRSPVDHLVLATKDLQEGIDQIEELLGLPTVRGGRHPALGTCNAHIALGPQCYLEIIGPDPDRPEFQGTRPFGIDSVDSPRLMGWAARRSGLPGFAQSAKSNGVDLGDVVAMSRVTPEGATLEWTLTFPPATGQGQVNVIPFFIDWGETPHPASRCKESAHLLELQLEHPEPDEIAHAATILEFAAVIRSGIEPKIVARVLCPRGEVVLS